MSHSLVKIISKNKDFLLRFTPLLPPPKYWPKKLHELRLGRNFYDVFGRHIDFQNPRTFNEKIQWYLINNRDPRVPGIIDKAMFKDYIREQLGEGYTAKLYGVWERIEDVDLSDIPLPFVIKANSRSEGENIVLVKSRDQINDALMSDMAEWLKWRNTNSNSSCFAYQRVKPKILAEEYLEGLDRESGEELTDYKFYCFRGKPYCAYTSIRVPGKHKITFYDMDWNALDATYAGYEKGPIPKPPHFEEMKKLAAALSKDFPFVRVDFYETTAGLRIGEMTFFSAFGLKPFSPESFDYELGEQFVLPGTPSGR